jgi:hypothetical protein
MVYESSVHTIFALNMQIPAILDLPISVTSESGSIPRKISIESQLKLRSLYEYVDCCRQTLDEIQKDASLMNMQRASERLERFCFEADSWGFDALYEIALGLQVLLMNANGPVYSNGFWEALQKGLAMLSALLEECERDFRLRLATADTLDAITEASGN